jgi:hypothetical protein
MITNIKIGGVIELDSEIDTNNEFSVVLERVAFDPSKGYSSRIDKNDNEVRTFKADNLGRVKILTEKDGKPELIRGKAKTVTASQILRLKIEELGLNYDQTIQIIINNFQKLL